MMALYGRHISHIICTNPYIKQKVITIKKNNQTDFKEYKKLTQKIDKKKLNIS